MIERLQGKVEKITLIKKISPSLDLCELQIDFDTLYIFYDMNELFQFQGVDVLYTTRLDMVEGKEALVICEIARLINIQTVSSIENVKLIPEGVSRTVCNLDSKNVRFGQYYPNVVALMSKYAFGSSAKSKWFDCTLIDMESREFVVKLFSSGTTREEMENILNPMIGRYVNFDMESTRYGFQTKEFIPLPQNVEESPEVVVAKNIITDLIAKDEALVEYNRKFGFLDCIPGIIDGEPGYAFVRMASELYMINAIDNISTELDIQAMRRAVVCSRGYLLPHKTDWSRPMLNSTKLLQIPELKKDKELMLILDVLSQEEPSATKRTYIEVRRLVDNIIKIRRGVSNEESGGINYAALSDMFNGLL